MVSGLCVKADQCVLVGDDVCLLPVYVSRPAVLVRDRREDHVTCLQVCLEGYIAVVSLGDSYGLVVYLRELGLEALQVEICKVDVRVGPHVVVRHDRYLHRLARLIGAES